MFRVELSRRAGIDVMEITQERESARGSEFAISYVNRMIDQIETLSQMPGRTRERTELGAGQHALILKPYLVFYRIAGDLVRVQRVLHGSRRITRHMLKD